MLIDDWIWVRECNFENVWKMSGNSVFHNAYKMAQLWNIKYADYENIVIGKK